MGTRSLVFSGSLGFAVLSIYACSSTTRPPSAVAGDAEIGDVEPADAQVGDERTFDGSIVIDGGEAIVLMKDTPCVATSVVFTALQEIAPLDDAGRPADRDAGDAGGVLNARTSYRSLARVGERWVAEERFGSGFASFLDSGPLTALFSPPGQVAMAAPSTSISGDVLVGGLAQDEVSVQRVSTTGAAGVRRTWASRGVTDLSLGTGPSYTGVVYSTQSRVFARSVGPADVLSPEFALTGTESKEAVSIAQAYVGDAMLAVWGSRRPAETEFSLQSSRYTPAGTVGAAFKFGFTPHAIEVSSLVSAGFEGAFVGNEANGGKPSVWLLSREGRPLRRFVFEGMRSIAGLVHSGGEFAVLGYKSDGTLQWTQFNREGVTSRAWTCVAAPQGILEASFGVLGANSGKHQVLFRDPAGQLQAATLE